jgi:Family of unknown function (DUF6338)
MLPIGSADQLLLVVASLAPGFIILLVRSQFLTGRMRPLHDAVLGYLVASAIYYGIAFPFIDGQIDSSASGGRQVLGWYALIIVDPIIFGVVSGLLSRFDILRKVLVAVSINPVHGMPTAWDWKFSRVQPSWILVTLKDDTKFHGLFGANSFAASDSTQHDLYIEQLYDIDEKNTWILKKPGKGAFIASNEIRSIEFWPDTDGEK